MCSISLAAAFIFTAQEAQAQPPTLTLSVATTFPNNQVIHGAGAMDNVSDPPAPWQNNVG